MPASSWLCIMGHGKEEMKRLSLCVCGGSAIYLINLTALTHSVWIWAPQVLCFVFDACRPVCLSLSAFFPLCL